jgi:hypothetical protein
MITLKLPRPLADDESVRLLSIAKELVARQKQFIEEQKAVVELQAKQGQAALAREQAKCRANETLNIKDASAANDLGSLESMIASKLTQAEKRLTDAGHIFYSYAGPAYVEVCQFLYPLLKEAFIDLVRPLLLPFIDEPHKFTELVKDLPAFKELAHRFARPMRCFSPEAAEPVAEEVQKMIENALEGNAVWTFRGLGESPAQVEQLEAA